MTEREVLKRLRSLVRYDQTQTDIAKKARVSPAFVCAVLKGTKEPSPKLLRLIGVERIVTYRPTSQPKRGPLTECDMHDDESL
jgi:transcriptional regulator with XRE-family HTH domain